MSSDVEQMFARFRPMNRLEAGLDGDPDDLAPIADGVDTMCLTLQTTAARKNHGDYIDVVVDGHRTRAHRVVWADLHMQMEYAEFQQICDEVGDLVIHHFCHRRSCVNVEHMALWSGRWNKRDAAMTTAAVKRARRDAA